MKNALFIILLVGAFFSAQLSAQNDSIADLENKPFEGNHLSLGFGISDPLGTLFALTIFTPSGWGGSITYNSISLDSKNLPSDFSYGTSWYNLSGSSQIEDKVFATSFRVTKEFPLSITPIIRLGLEAGPSIVITNVPDHFVLNPKSCNFFGCPTNYDFERVHYQTVGLSLKAKLEFPVTIPLGVEMDVSADINRNRSFVAFEFLFNIGDLRDPM